MNEFKIDFEINGNCVKTLRSLWKDRDKKVKFEYHSLHFCNDGYVYFAGFQFIFRTKYSDSPVSFPEDINCLAVNLGDFLSLIPDKARMICGSISQKSIEVQGKTISIPADIKYIRNINKLYVNWQDMPELDFKGYSKYPAAAIRFLDCFLSEWTVNFLHKEFAGNGYNWIERVTFQDDRTVFFVYGQIFDMMFVPVSIR